MQSHDHLWLIVARIEVHHLVAAALNKGIVLLKSEPNHDVR
jgi:hypothetical protein